MSDPRLLMYRLRKNGKPPRTITSYPLDELGVHLVEPNGLAGGANIDHGPVRIKLRVTTEVFEVCLTQEQATALGQALLKPRLAESITHRSKNR
jgi:hypothetical protein